MAGPWEEYQTPAAGPWEAYQQPEPPPGVMIHEGNRSYITGGGPSANINTSGLDPEQANAARMRAAAALQMRQNNAIPLPQAAMPPTQGATMSFGDELASLGFGAGQALKGGSFPEAYGVAQEAQRQALAAEREQNPGRSLLTQIGGAMALAPALGTIGGMGGGTPLAARMGIGAGIGGTYGGIEGFGSGSGLQNRLEQAATGGVTGGILGGLAPAVMQGAKSGFNFLFDRPTVTKPLRSLGLGRPAADTTMRVMAADDAFSGTGARNLAVAGPDAMLVDVGPSTRKAFDTAIQRGGPATLKGMQAVEERGRQGSRTLRATFDKLFGKPEGAVAATTRIREAGRPANNAAYLDAYGEAIDYSAPRARELQQALTRVPKDVINESNRFMQLDFGDKARRLVAEAAPDGTVSFNELPNVQQLDYITRGLRGLAEAGKTAGAAGGRDPASAKYISLANDIRDILREMVPKYGKALDTAADPISRNQAINFGYELLKPNIKRDVAEMRIGRMTSREKESLGQGVRSYLDDLMAKVKGTAANLDTEASEAFKALKELSSRDAKEKLALFLKPGEVGFLTREIARAGKAAELAAATAANSATFGRTAMAEAAKQVQGSPPVTGVTEALHRAARYMLGRTPKDRLAAEDDMYRQMVDLLTRLRGPDALSAMQKLTDAYRAAPTNEARARQIGGYLGSVLGLGGYQGWQHRPVPRR